MRRQEEMQKLQDLQKTNFADFQYMIKVNFLADFILLSNWKVLSLESLFNAKH